eukprot:s899_g15.t1
MVFCPQFYFLSVLNVWPDQANFVQVPLSTERRKIDIHSSIPGNIQRKYAWGINANARLTQGFVFLKQKKEFRNGRSVIAYNNTITEKLQRGTASAIEHMIQTCFPLHFGSMPLPLIWDKLHDFFLNTPWHVALTLKNDDLVGVFNSVPQVRIAQAVGMLLFRLQEVSFSTRLTVNISPNRRQIKSISGATKKAGDSRLWKLIDVEDIPTVVQVSFSCGIFGACGVRWKQHDGTCIGNQISPILSSLPVLCTEVGWQRLFASSKLIAGSSIVRYVDNRLIITSLEHADSLAIRTLVSPFFYGAPIELEDVGDDHILGLRVLVDKRQIHFIPASHLWQVRHPKSACSETHLLSGLRSRICTIRSYVWPAFLREDQVRTFKMFHIQSGYPSHLVLPL